MRRGASGKLDHSAITIVWPDTAYQPTNWRTSELDRKIRGLAKCFPNALSLLQLPQRQFSLLQRPLLLLSLLQRPLSRFSLLQFRLRRNPLRRISQRRPIQTSSSMVLRSARRSAPRRTPQSVTPATPATTTPAFAWCQWRHAETRKFGPETVWMSVFRSGNNSAVEITQAVDPAFFRQGDVEREIQRLSRDFGQQARVIAVDLPAGGRAVIAVWGAVTLTPLDSTTLDALRRGAPVHSGLLVGALGDLRVSARQGVPVYSLGGGAGFIWSANYTNSGKGVLRITAVDPSALNSATAPQAATSAPSPGTPPPVAAEPLGTPSPNPDEAARREGADQVEKVVVAAMRPTGSANAPASSRASPGQTEEAKLEQPPTAYLASPALPLSPPGRRVALVVANGAYREAPLTNPTVDAGIVAGSLEKIGFSVTVKKDLDLDGFEQAISEFADTTKGAEIALFYFAGHGFSVAAGGRQQALLMATSANFSAKTALALEGGGEPLEHVEETIVGHARATLIFIDACRNIPAIASRGFGSRGFAPLDASNFEGAYVVLSTRVGQTAEDGAGGQGSPFARAFASVLPTPGLRIEDAYYRMREQVRRETSGVQVPDSIRSDLPEGGVVLVENTTK
jgi:hypothetical protein